MGDMAAANCLQKEPGRDRETSAFRSQIVCKLRAESGCGLEVGREGDGLEYTSRLAPPKELFASPERPPVCAASSRVAGVDDGRGAEDRPGALYREAIPLINLRELGDN